MTLARATAALPLALGLLVALAAGEASASPAVEGTRNLSLGDAARASASGTSAFLANPSAMGSVPTLIVDSNYQAVIERNTHGFSVMAVDSLNSTRVALGLGYTTQIGYPKIRFVDPSAGEDPRDLTLRDDGHEVGLALSINVVKGWFAIGVKPKYQRTTLRFVDPDGERRDAQAKIDAFGLDLSATLSILEWVNLAVVGYNLAGPMSPAYESGRELTLAPFPITPGTIEHRYLPRISDYPRALAHSIAVYPFKGSGLVLGADGYYDFTSYRDQRFVRMRFSGSGEYMVGKVALRAGGGWDSLGRGKDDDRGYVSGGLGVILRPEPSKFGVDFGVGFRRDVTGPYQETFLGANLGLLINPMPAPAR
ncbi:MAG: hypothetical protein R3B09_01490 [Nannocystaceae bacterium]